MRKKRLIKDCRGNALLEFALVFPLFIALILGMINLSLALHNNVVAAAAARDAGRVAAVTGSKAPWQRAQLYSKTEE